MTPLLSVNDLHVAYVGNGRPVVAVDGVSFDVHKRKALGVIGESGSGKSTLMHAVLRLHNPKTTEVGGSVKLDGREIMTMQPEELFKVRWAEMSVVFQKSMNALSPVHRIKDFMSEIYRTHKPEAGKEEAGKRIKELLNLVSLPERVASMYPHELSGGMMQRVSIALSLMFSPKLLILDEATTALDVVTQTQILKEIREIEEKLDLTRVMVTHDMSVVASTCDNVCIMYAGKMLEYGPVSDTLVKPLHPYTQNLVESFPDFADDPSKELKSIKGSMPDLRDAPKGCVFAPRCERAEGVCRAERPAMKDFGGRRAACHLI